MLSAGLCLGYDGRQVKRRKLTRHVSNFATTDFHAKYFAHELTKRCASGSIEKLAQQTREQMLFSNRWSVI